MFFASNWQGGKDFIVFNGPDEQFVAGRIMGADAGIGGTYGAMPELYMKMDELIKRGEWDKAAEVQAIVTPLIYRFMLLCFHARSSKRNHHSGRMSDG